MSTRDNPRLVYLAAVRRAAEEKANLRGRDILAVVALEVATNGGVKQFRASFSDFPSGAVAMASVRLRDGTSQRVWFTTEEWAPLKALRPQGTK